MFKFLKYLPALALFRQSAGEYKKREGLDKPWYITRRFLAGIVGGVAVILGVKFGIEIEKDTISTIIENLHVIVPAIYSTIMMIVGIVKREKVGHDHA